MYTHTNITHSQPPHMYVCIHTSYFHLSFCIQTYTSTHTHIYTHILRHNVNLVMEKWRHSFSLQGSAGSFSFASLTTEKKQWPQHRSLPPSLHYHVNVCKTLHFQKSRGVHHSRRWRGGRLLSFHSSHENTRRVGEKQKHRAVGCPRDCLFYFQVIYSLPAGLTGASRKGVKRGNATRRRGLCPG